MCPLQMVVIFGVCCSFLVLILISVERVAVCRQFFFLFLILFCLCVVNVWVQSHQCHLVLMDNFPFVAYQCQIRWLMDGYNGQECLMGMLHL